MRWAVIVGLLIAGCGKAPPGACDSAAELTKRCEPRESPETTRSICRNAYEHMGEDDQSPRGRGLMTVNAALRAQAECAVTAATCDDWKRCRKLR